MSGAAITGSVQPGIPPIVSRIADEQRRRQLSFRIIFAITWAIVVTALMAPILLSDFKWDYVSTYAPFILGGAGTTVLVSVLSITIAVLLAILGSLGRLSANPVINGIASLYVSLIRGTPLLVQLWFWYLGLSEIGQRTGLRFLTLPLLVVGIAALAVNYGAYMTEIFRAGIQAVPRGQREAAQALGMPEHLVMRRIVLPQAFRIVVPAIGNEFIAMIKDTSLVSVIGIQELLWRGKTTGQQNVATFEGLLVAAAVYWVLTIVFSFFQERLERRLARGDR
jgi:polar amino acid transport system permease protein